MNRRTLTAPGLIVGIMAGALAGGAAFAEARRFYDPATRAWLSAALLRSPVGAPVRRDDFSPIKREVVTYAAPYAPGTIVVETSQRRLYYTLGDGKAMRYGVGVGREGFQWAGTNRITRKAEWPGWTPPPAMRRRQPHLPAYVEGGPDSPLGARAMYIGSTYYRIHGSNQPWTIGQAVSSGCIRMANEDVIDLYERVKIGTKVVVKH